MSHLLVLPIVLPALTAALLLLMGRQLAISRVISFVASTLLLLIGIQLFQNANSGAIQTYVLGDWVAPFGIVLVLDRLSGLMVLLTSIVAIAALFYAMQGWDQRGKYFHTLFQFQLMGINGAFLTGDLFNLFVFFEVLLIASYCLLVYGFGERRLRAAVHYVVINLTGSALFLIGVSILYGLTGTLNMAQLAERFASSTTDDIALIRSASLLLIAVFGIKAALFPLYFWLPNAYASASAPVAALFAIMTKIGIYAIFRFNSLIFSGSEGVTADITSPWLMPVAMLTLVLGGFGALAAKRLLELIAYLTVASVGMILMAYSIGNQASFSGALFYMVHSTLISAALFLLAEMIGQARGSIEEKLQTGPLMKQGVALGITVLIAGAIAIGLPLSSGFLAKLMILQSATLNPHMPMIWTIILLASFIGLIGLSRAGSTLFWKTSHEYAADARFPSFGQWLPIVFLLTISLLMVIYAAPLKQITDQTATQMKAPQHYIDAVIGQTADRAPRALPREPRP